MCGIVITTSDSIEQMASKISHRGIEPPKYDKVGNYNIAFIRLPITDPNSPNQPFEVENTKTWLNGFISNYKELAEKYNIQLDTNCDTELLAKFLHLFGLNKTNELNGFFSVIHWNGELNMFTDRYGIKQLYKYEDETGIYISSEVKALPVKEIYSKAKQDWFYSLGIMTDNTIWLGVTRVPCLPFIKPDKIDISYEDAKLVLLTLWLQSIKRNYHLNGGVMLSGGVDSGMIAEWFEPKYSFSMDYQCEKSEIEGIKINSKGTHYTIIHNDSTLKTYLDKTRYYLDDLKAGSCYTNFALFELASKFTRVVYSGAGADEVFKGYTHRYNKPINDVIKRSDSLTIEYDISHSDYDWLYLKGILVVEDRMSSAHAVETRYPFLDNDFVDFALSLPDEYLKEKRILKDISGLDESILKGKKRGFSNPISNKDWMELMFKDYE